jgi:signal transduction histidine kinase
VGEHRSRFMLIRPLDRLIARISQRVPLQTFLTVPFLLQIVAVAGLTGGLSWLNAQKSVYDLTAKLQDEISSGIQLELKTYLEAPQLTTRINNDAVQLGQLNLQDPRSLERHLFTQLTQFKSVSGILIGTAEGTFRAVNRRGQLRLQKSDRAEAGVVYNFEIDGMGEQGKFLDTYQSPSVQATKWYSAAATARKPTWSPIFQTGDNQDLSLNASSPIYDPDTGDLLGVASAGVVLSKINAFLKNLQVSESGLVFVVEHDGKLVGTSASQQVYRKIEGKNGRVKLDRINAADSRDPLIKATAQFLVGRYGDFTKVIADQRLNFMNNGDRNFVKVVPFRDELGLDWLIVVVVPENDFMAQINANTRTTFWLSAGAVFVTLLLGVIGSNWVAQPMLRLSRASRAIAEGDLYQRVPEQNPIKEMQVTAHAFNQMAERLTASFEQIEAANANLEAQVSDRTAQLLQAIEELERLNRIKDDFLSTVSHELRTPMSNIKLSTQMLEINLKRLGLLDSESSSIPRYFQILKDEGQREINLINNLLDLSRLDAKTDPIMPTVIQLNDWLPEVVKPFIERANSQQQAFYLKIADNLPPLTTDLAELERILNELLNNACKYTPPGAEITLAARVAGAVEPELEQEHWQQEHREQEHWEKNRSHVPVLYTSVQTPPAHRSTASRTVSHVGAIDRLQISISNSGVEIPDGEHHRIFDKFYRIPSSDPWKHGGTGLGLALVKGLVERLEGTIEVESGEGLTTFTVELPFDPTPTACK